MHIRRVIVVYASSSGGGPPSAEQNTASPRTHKKRKKEKKNSLELPCNGMPPRAKKQKLAKPVIPGLVPQAFTRGSYHSAATPTVVRFNVIDG